jgi:solute:Na+ symporter, SSS family
MTLSPLLPQQYGWLRNTLHQNMVIVIGTLTIFMIGVLITRYRQGSNGAHAVTIHK